MLHIIIRDSKRQHEPENIIFRDFQELTPKVIEIALEYSIFDRENGLEVSSYFELNGKVYYKWYRVTKNSIKLIQEKELEYENLRTSKGVL